jgi:hypothetical protein
MSGAVTVPAWVAILVGIAAAWAVYDCIMAPGVRWYLRSRANRVLDEVGSRLKLEIRPFQRTRREALIDVLVHDDRVQETAAAHACEHDMPREVVTERIREYAREIVPAFNAYFYFRIGNRLGHWDMEFTKIAAHPVTRGVKPFAAPADGWLYNLHFAAEGLVPLLVGAVPDKSRSTADAKKHAGRDEVIAWACEHPDGARCFGFTGADLHKSWSYESQRKLVLNGILWAAKLPVPSDGATATFDPVFLERNLDDKRVAIISSVTPTVFGKP